MKSVYYIKNCFVKQLTENDCGHASLKMIHAYFSGNIDMDFIVPDNCGEKAASLLDLKNAAVRLGLKPKCVSMTIEFLRTWKTPVILHVFNDAGEPHFVVCFGVKRIGSAFKYIIGDPAAQVCILEEDQLDLKWQSKAAVIFENALSKSSRFFRWPAFSLLSLNLLPKEQLILLPVLTLITTTLGLAVSWVLEKGMDASFLKGSRRLFFPVLILLVIVSLFKCLLAYLKQRILLGLNLSINEKLVAMYSDAQLIKSKSQKAAGAFSIKNGLADIYKVQNALSSLVSVFLSDGLLMIAVLSCLFYNDPLTGWLDLFYIILMGTFAVSVLSKTTVQNIQISDAAGEVELQIAKDAGWPGNLITGGAVFKPDGQSIRDNYFKLLRGAGINISRHSLFYESSG
ncbi:MAG TPA: cysteine peptidase family C39 domain-containing protein, partial [Mucilaginibacter sp.]